jgi:hypothetical protein
VDVFNYFRPGCTQEKNAIVARSREKWKMPFEPMFLLPVASRESTFAPLPVTRHARLDYEDGSKIWKMGELKLFLKETERPFIVS